MGPLVRTSSSLLARSLIAISLGACGALGGDDAESADNAYRVRPTDGEDLARLRVATPPGWIPQPNPSDDAEVRYRGEALALNATRRLKVGDGKLTVRSKFDVTVDAGNVPLAQGTTTDYVLASLWPTYETSTTLARDFGPTPALAVFFTAPGQQEQQVWGQHRTNALFWSGKSAYPLLAPTGSYRFSWTLPVIEDLTEVLTDGGTNPLSLTPPERRGTILVKKPGLRELPDPSTAEQCHVPTRTFLVHRRGENADGALGEPPSGHQRATTYDAALAVVPGYHPSGEQLEDVVSWAALPMKRDTPVKVFPFTAAERPNHYEVVVNGVVVPVDVKPGETKTVRLERLDVDDVEVTKETGEKYMVKGTWRLFRQGAGGAWLPITTRVDCGRQAPQPLSVPTGTGLDVLPAKYRIVVSYTTGEGPKEKVFEIDVL